MSNKTLYIRPADEPTWEKAKRLILLHERTSLSQHLSDHLRQVVEKYKALPRPDSESVRVLREALKGLQTVGYLDDSSCASKEGAAALRVARDALTKVGDA